MFRDYISVEIQSRTGYILCLRLFFALLFTMPVANLRADGIFDFGDLYFETVNDESNPLRVVTALTQDLEGFLWIGSENGLLRYDGYQFRRFVYSVDDPYSISGNKPKSLSVAADGKLWVGTQDSGVSVFDPDTERFQRYSHLDDDPHSLASNRVMAIASDPRRGGIWIGTNNGLDYLNPITQKLTHYRHDPKDLNSINHNIIRSLLVDAEGNLWVGSNGLNKLPVGGTQFERSYSNPSNSDSLAGQLITILMEADDGNIWMGIAGRGAAWIDLKANKINRLTKSPENVEGAKGLSGSSVRAIVQASANEIWISSGGITVVDPATGTVIRQINHDSIIPSSINSNDIAALWRDRSGLVWVGTWGGGLNRHNPVNAAFRNLHFGVNDSAMLSNANVGTVIELTNGEVWIGNRGNGIDIIDPVHGSITGLRVDPLDPNALQNGYIEMIEQTTDATVWVATREGLHRYFPESGNFIRYTVDDGLLHNMTKTLLKTVDGGLWIGSEGGLNYWNPDSNTITEFKRDKLSDKPFNQHVNAVAQTPDGTLWVGTSNGLFILKQGTNHLIAINPKELGDLAQTIPQTLSNKFVVGLLVDSHGKLWVSTIKGLDRLIDRDGQRARFESISTLVGRPGAYVSANMLEDNDGYFWGHDTRINSKTWAIREFGRAEGLHEGTAWIGSYDKTRDGTFLQGGTMGVQMIKPALFKEWTFQPPVVISALHINGKQVPRAFDELILQPEVRSMSFEFTALDFSAPEKNRHAYKLDGFDPDWIETDTRNRRATYTNLDPGEYVLRIKGSNRLGVWSEHQVALVIHQLPAWYQTTWFKILLILSGLALVYSFLEYRTRVLKQRTKLLKSLVDEKTADIKSILSAIQQGILAIEDDNGKIGPEHSKFLGELVGTEDIVGQSFYDLLFQNSTFTEDEKSQIMGVISASVGEEEFGFMMNSHLLPREAVIYKNIEKDNEQQIYELDWNPIIKDNIVTKILLVVRDVTELRELELTSKKQRQEIATIQEIINVPASKFDSMIKSCYRFIEENRQIINQGTHFKLESIQHLFRNMHTMKGLARSYQLSSLSEAAHIAEQFYSQSIESKAWKPDLMLAELDKAKQIINNYKQVNHEKLGRSSKDSKKLEIDRDIVENNLALLSDFDLSELSDDGKIRIASIKHLFRRLIRNPLEQVIHDQVKATASLARQLDKVEPLIVFDDPGFSINTDAHELINNVFTHLIRNAIDHGLEMPDERIKAGKPAQGKLTFALEEKNTQLQIKFSDDGRGLNLPVIYQTAIKKGIINEPGQVNPEYVANLIFASGFSTAKQVSDISGRGVGMDAVKNFLENEGCSIEIRVLDPSINELLFSPVEFVITLPTKFFQSMSESESESESEI